MKLGAEMTISEELLKQFEQARLFLDKYQSFLLVSHEYTDGDDLGSMLSLAGMLEKQGKKTIQVALGGVPDNLLFMPGQAEVRAELPSDYESRDALITLGCGNLARTGFAELEKWNKPILSFDHHHDTKLFGTVNVWDETRAANCELIYFFLTDSGVPIDRFTALNLLTGLFTDTGGFRHASVKAETFEIAAELLRRGAKLDLVSRFTFSQKDLPALRAWSIALENARFDSERKVVYTVITEKDLEQVGATEDDLNGVVELLNTIPEAKFSLLIKQRGDEIKGSLRSEPYKGVDVSKIARVFGGGGHRLAAGFKFKGRIERTESGWKIT